MMDMYLFTVTKIIILLLTALFCRIFFPVYYKQICVKKTNITSGRVTELIVFLIWNKKQG